MRGVRGLVRLRKVGVVVSFGVDRVIPIPIRLVALVSFIVTVGVVDVLNRVLTRKRQCRVVARAQRRYSQWVGRRDDRSRAWADVL